MKRFGAWTLCLILGSTACSGGETVGSSTTTVAPDPGTEETTTSAAEPEFHLEPGSITAGVVLVDEVVREYLVAVPPTYSPDQPAPLLFDLHGRGGTAPGQAMTSGATDLGWAAGFVVVHPQAKGEVATWSVWPELPEMPGDVAFFEMMIDAISDELSIDQDRIFVMGFSNGGGFAGRLACELPDRFAAFAAVGASNEGWLQCDPGKPIPVIAIHGLADQIIPFDGGQALLPAIPDWAAWWAENNGCGEVVGPAAMPTGGFWHWPDCENGATVSLLALNDVGHDWPRAIQAVPVDDGLRWLGATEIILDFFLRQ